jgi:hypothetical protein
MVTRRELFTLAGAGALAGPLRAVQAGPSVRYRDYSRCLPDYLRAQAERAMEAEGTFVAINNRVSQSVPHLHVHIVPRRKKDGLRGFFWGQASGGTNFRMGLPAKCWWTATARMSSSGWSRRLRGNELKHVGHVGNHHLSWI